MRLQSLLMLLIFPTMLSAQQNLRPTYYEPGVVSPWAIGIDYDVGFARVLSFNTAFVGGITSQVNEASNFGDIFFGEAQIGFRLYLNKPDTWSGTFIGIPIRIGIYNLPLRLSNNPVLFDRFDSFVFGMGIFLGYRWARSLVSKQSDFPFVIAIEPFLGWSIDFLSLPIDAIDRGYNINRFSLGISLKLGFYTHPKSAIVDEELLPNGENGVATEAEIEGLGITETLIEDPVD